MNMVWKERKIKIIYKVVWVKKKVVASCCVFAYFAVEECKRKKKHQIFFFSPKERVPPSINRF